MVPFNKTGAHRHLKFLWPLSMLVSSVPVGRMAFRRPPLLVFAQFVDVMVTHDPRYPTRVVSRHGLPQLMRRLTELEENGLTRTVLTSKIMESQGATALRAVEKLHRFTTDPAFDFSQNGAHARIVCEAATLAAETGVRPHEIRLVMFDVSVRTPAAPLDCQVAVHTFVPAWTRQDRQERRTQGIRPEDDATLQNMGDVIESLAKTDMPVPEAVLLQPQIKNKPLPDIGAYNVLLSERVAR